MYCFWLSSVKTIPQICYFTTTPFLCSSHCGHELGKGSAGGLPLTRLSAGWLDQRCPSKVAFHDSSLPRAFTQDGLRVTVLSCGKIRSLIRLLWTPNLSLTVRFIITYKVQRQNKYPAWLILSSRPHILPAFLLIFSILSTGFIPNLVFLKVAK